MCSPQPTRAAKGGDAGGSRDTGAGQDGETSGVGDGVVEAGDRGGEHAESLTICTWCCRVRLSS